MVFFVRFFRNWKKCFVVFLCLGSCFCSWAVLHLGIKEDRPFCTPFIWHLAAAASCALLGISSIRVFGTHPVLTSLHFSSSLSHCPVHLSQDVSLSSSLSFTLWVSPMLIRPYKEYFFQLDIEESTRAQSFYSSDIHTFLPFLTYCGKEFWRNISLIHFYAVCKIFLILSKDVIPGVL